jgi:hypothetical protein
MDGLRMGAYQRGNIVQKTIYDVKNNFVDKNTDVDDDDDDDDDYDFASVG